MYDFTKVASEDGAMVPPAGTIGVFTIKGMKQENVEGGAGAFVPKAGEKVFIQIDFGNEEFSFDERFYMLDWDREASVHKPHSSMKRIHHLYHRVTEQELGNGVTFEQLKAALVGKSIALAIGANCRETDEGWKAFSQIKYMNFARKPEEMGELRFNQKDQDEITRYKAIREAGKSSSADAPTSSNGSPAPFAASPDNKF